MIKNGFPKERRISKVVYETFRGNIDNYIKSDMNKAEKDIYPNVLKTTIVTYLFNLSPRSYYCKPLELSMIRKGVKHQYVLYTLNGISRICPIMDEYEEGIIRSIFDYTYNQDRDSINFDKDYLGTIRGFTNSLQRVGRQIHNDALFVFKQLEIELEDQKMAIKALRDIRVADAIINQKVDWGFMKVYGIGLRKRLFFENNFFKEDIEKYFKEEVGIRSYMNRSYRS